MAAPTLIRRELANARIYFIPAGETVDTVTVAAETWPDNDPTTNYTDYEIPDIEKVVLEKKLVEEEFMVPSDTGGYDSDDEEMVTSRMWTITTAKTNNRIKQLDKGLAAAVAASTAQAHGTVKDNYLLGVLLIEEQGKGGSMIERTHVWAKMRVKSSGETGPATRKIEVSFKHQYSSLNTFTAYA
jgi:hypothetical protein